MYRWKNIKKYVKYCLKCVRTNSKKNNFNKNNLKIKTKYELDTFKNYLNTVTDS